MNHTLVILEKIKLALIYHGSNISNIIMEHRIYPIDKIYLGKVSNIIPGLDAAFIQLDESKEKNGFIHFNKLKKEHIENRSNKSKYCLVQITREPIGNKGPTVSTNVAFKGKYINFYPFQQNIYQKKKIENNREYSYAIGCLLGTNKSSISLNKNIMTVDANFLISESNNLKNKWTKLIAKSKFSPLPSSLNEEENFIYKLFKDYDNIKFNSIHIDSLRGSLKIKKILSKILVYKNNLSSEVKIHYHRSKDDLIKYLSLDLILSDITKPRVNLYKGGYIVIEKTEALTTIDINSGSFKSSPNSRQTSLWINYLAIHEIAKQIKLRNIGGIIIIDFIDSTTQDDQMKLLKYINKLLKKDDSKCNIVQISELGLLELTRTRQRQSVYDAFTCKCKVCNGLGYRSNYIHVSLLNMYSLLINFSPLFLKNQTSYL